MTKANLKRLIGIYKALGGLMTEHEDPFGRIYKGGTDALMRDFEAALKGEGVVFKDCEYSIVEYYSKTMKRNEWGICTDPTNPEDSWCLTGFSTQDEAKSVLNDRRIFTDYDGTPPRVIPLSEQAA